jgi:hypothetical protein
LRIAVSQNSSEPETGAAKAANFVGWDTRVSAVVKLDLRTVSLLARKDAAATAAIVAPAERPSQKGRTCRLVILRTSSSTAAY